MEKQCKREKILVYKERKIVGGVYCIKNTVNGKMLVQSAVDLHGAKNRFVFAQQTNYVPHFKLQEDWQTVGKDAFVFEVLEELEKKDEQNPKEFAEDVKTLEELWCDKLEKAVQY